MAKHWWKALAVILLIYTIIAGFTIDIPIIGTNQQSSRGLFFHVPMWMCMYTMFSISVANSLLYLTKYDLKRDALAGAAGSVGVFFGILGFCTGTLWATYTWGGTITGDAKQQLTAVALLIYMAYLVLRMSIPDIDKRARISAVFNIFAFALLIPLTYIIPRMVDSLHPGAAGSPTFASKDTDGGMKAVLYPAFIGWVLLSVWIYTLVVRYKKLELKNIFK
ncbi:cytochrome c biogenesis protein CcsA [Chitinophaga sancti]|uniref:Cytochrome c biogenesis protein CcsA n=1 Tax=Chitinophaga sancti TaxID=1004 RepID=A0A1K1Q803_9BACT|nr:cytochrome c biogenesis protein CcsA [Chitinophaga sancti]WQD61205.1 cytochrome c biogenesis protein CcsA [Chitinophaga sancti]WQG86668.1 cytochrome c biogenesis protein CcsA [Chitinophaga sancti]SFW55803.1 heme exporter protein C [Chitinophaga sancti]